MNNTRQLFLDCTGLLVLALLGLNVHAAPILSTNAEFLTGGVLVSGDPASGPPPATVSSFVNGDGSTLDFSGNAFANAVSTAGIGAVRTEGVFAAGGSDVFELRATSSFGETVTNSTGITQDYFFDFNVFGPRLEIADFARGPDVTVQYSIEVVLDGLTIWGSSATLFGGAPAFTLTQSGTDLGATFFCNNTGCTESNPGSRFGYTFGNLSDRLSLGAIADGDSFTLNTIMNVSVATLPFEMGGLALIGDPGDIGASPGVSGSLGVVPVPAAVWLFGSGLVGLVALARRKAA